jgi:hypothetical protein
MANAAFVAASIRTADHWPARGNWDRGDGEAGFRGVVRGGVRRRRGEVDRPRVAQGHRGVNRAGDGAPARTAPPGPRR